MVHGVLVPYLTGRSAGLRGPAPIPAAHYRFVAVPSTIAPVRPALRKLSAPWASPDAVILIKPPQLVRKSDRDKRPIPARSGVAFGLYCAVQVFGRHLEPSDSRRKLLLVM
jgi:hypothetical protein